MKKILMLLLTIMFLFALPIKTYAMEIIDLGVLEKYDNIERDSFLPLNHISYETEEDRIYQITIPEFSYFMARSCNLKFTIYEDKDLKNEILSANPPNTIDLFLPEGVYYIKIHNIGCVDSLNIFPPYFKYGRTSIENLLKVDIEKKSKKYETNFYNYVTDTPRATIIGIEEEVFSGFYYNSDVYLHFSCDAKENSKYDITLTCRMNCKNKKSKVKIEIVGGENLPNDFMDFTEPTVTGVKNNKTYKKTVTFKVSDKSGIKKVTLNGKKMKNSKFMKGYKIKRKSTTKKYTLKVWDKAGNCTTVKFKIKKNKKS